MAIQISANVCQYYCWMRWVCWCPVLSSPFKFWVKSYSSSNVIDSGPFLFLLKMCWVVNQSINQINFCVTQNHKLQFILEGFTNCTGVTSSVVRLSHWARKNLKTLNRWEESGKIRNLQQSRRGGNPIPRMDRRAIDVTCTEHNNKTITIYTV